ncbi:CRISPR-associated endonuclease Cas2 [Enterococcus cecorum]|uniref:CRISPR-associated endonuclease Cas2 n=1 Tax=Enterococcus cecorum TaxID=44008 RepID=UPI00200B6B04|nr:CRISPR-associated endonuclease Cas2 [Enterococcus cecorum]
MMLLVCFDLPRDTKEKRKDARKFRQRLLDMGFTLKQYSLYERPIQRSNVKEKIIAELTEKLPKYGLITVYTLPDDVNDEQLQILGENAVKKSSRFAKFVIL